jgi:hypothetical protein
MHVMLLLLALDLTTIRNEPNLEHRSDLALDYANTALDAAREALNAGEDAKFLTSLGEAREAVELSWHSLTDSGKYARNSNSFKRAEVRTRGLMRRLDGLRDLAGIDEKTEIEKVHARVAEIHDELIQGIMGKKVKKQE